MGQYLTSIIIVSIIIGIIELIAPRYGNLDKYVKMICTLIMLLVIISPVLEMINGFDMDLIDEIKDKIDLPSDEKADEYNEILKEYIKNHSIGELKLEIKSILDKEFKIPSEECDVEIFTQTLEGNASVSKVQILLSGKSVFKNPYNIEDYISSLLGCGCQVLIK